MLSKLDVDKATLIAIAEADKMFSEMLQSYEGLDDGKESEIEEGLQQLVERGGGLDRGSGRDEYPAGSEVLRPTQGA